MQSSRILLALGSLSLVTACSGNGSSSMNTAPASPVTPASVQSTCPDAESKKAEVAAMNANDRALLDQFYAKNKKLIESMSRESTEAMEILRQALVNDSPETVGYAKQLKYLSNTPGAELFQPTQRLLNVKLFRLSLSALSKNNFYTLLHDTTSASPYSFQPLTRMAYDEETLRLLEVGTIRSDFYLQNIKRVTGNFIFGVKPIIQESEGVTIVASIISPEVLERSERKPWEMIVFNSYSSPSFSADVLPSIKSANMGRTVNVRIEYVTQRLFLDLSSGNVRTVDRAVDSSGYVQLDPSNPKMGAARVTADYTPTRMAFVKDLSNCK